MDFVSWLFGFSTGNKIIGELVQISARTLPGINVWSFAALNIAILVGFKLGINYLRFGFLSLSVTASSYAVSRGETGHMNGAVVLMAIGMIPVFLIGSIHLLQKMPAYWSLNNANGSFYFSLQMLNSF
jgi:hypothetical protein